MSAAIRSNAYAAFETDTFPAVRLPLQHKVRAGCSKHLQQQCMLLQEGGYSGGVSR